MGSQLKGSWWPTEDGRGGQKGASAGAQLIFPFSTAQNPSLVMVLPTVAGSFSFV